VASIGSRQNRQTAPLDAKGFGVGQESDPDGVGLAVTGSGRTILATRPMPGAFLARPVNIFPLLIRLPAALADAAKFRDHTTPRQELSQNVIVHRLH
jgi:hypothetical protein